MFFDGFARFSFSNFENLQKNWVFEQDSDFAESTPQSDYNIHII